MRLFERFERQCMEDLGSRPMVLDVGGGSRFQKRMALYRDLFASCEYKTMDVSADYRPDIVGDILAIPLPDASVDGVICMSVLEHVKDPRQAVREIHRILKPGGAVYVTVPSTYPYHARKGFGAYPDYWRFFDDTLRDLFSAFSSVEIVKHGGWFAAMSFFAPGQARTRKLLDPIASSLDTIFRTNRRTTTPFFSVMARK
jgi:SAM-dependent methyltransferase